MCTGGAHGNQSDVSTDPPRDPVLSRDPVPIGSIRPTIPRPIPWAPSQCAALPARISFWCWASA